MYCLKFYKGKTGGDFYTFFSKHIKDKININFLTSNFAAYMQGAPHPYTNINNMLHFISQNSRNA